MDPDPDLTIILLGNTGGGKSASGNTILGRRAFESRQSFRPVTTQISEQTGTVFGKQISVIDTPGIFGSEREIQTCCQRVLLSSRPVLFLVVFSVGRFTKEQAEVMMTVGRVLGPQVFDKCQLLFTGGDALKDRSLEDFIYGDEESSSHHTTFLQKCHLFNNVNEGREQVRELLMKTGHLGTQEPPDSPVDDSRNLRIVLLGLPGAGKSSSGNTILRSEQFKPGCGFGLVSKETISKSAIVEGRQVTVVDTPGISDEVQTGEQLFKEIMKSVVKASPGLHAFVIVLRIDRITEADKKKFEMLPKLFERDAHKYSVVLFTHGDELGGRSINDLIRSDRHVSDLVSMCGGRFCVFDNKTKRSREQVRNFLSKVDEMVSDNGGQHYTDDMFRMAQTFIKEERNMSGETGQSRVLKRLLLHLSTHKRKYFLIVLVAIGGALVGSGKGALVGAGIGALVGVGIGAGAGK